MNPVIAISWLRAEIPVYLALALAFAGAWLSHSTTADYFRPRLELRQAAVERCEEREGDLIILTNAQNNSINALAAEREKLEIKSRDALAQAKADAAAHLDRASRLQQERGNSGKCENADAAINEEIHDATR